MNFANSCAPDSGPVVLELEVHGETAVVVRADRRGRDLVATEQRGKLLQIQHLAGGGLSLTKWDEVELTGLADESAHGIDVRNAGQLDHDAVRALYDDDGLRNAGRVHAALHDVLDDAHALRGRRDAVLGERLVLDPQATLEVEPELRLDKAPLAVARRRIGQAEVREEDDQQGEHPDDDDHDGSGSSHTGGMVHAAPRGRLRTVR